MSDVHLQSVTIWNNACQGGSTVDLVIHFWYSHSCFLVDFQGFYRGNLPVHIISHIVTLSIKSTWSNFFEKWEIVWQGGLPHLSELPHLPGVPHLHVNRPFMKSKPAWQAVVRELKQRRFWATHVNRKWTFCTLEPWFWTNFWADRFCKN